MIHDRPDNLVPIKGHNNLFRDDNTGMIVSINNHTSSHYKRVREHKRQEKQESAKQAAKDIAQEAKDTGKSIAEVGRERAPSSESKTAAEKAKEEGDPRNMKSGGLASRKKKKK